MFIVANWKVISLRGFRAVNLSTWEIQIQAHLSPFYSDGPFYWSIEPDAAEWDDCWSYFCSSFHARGIQINGKFDESFLKK